MGMPPPATGESRSGRLAGPTLEEAARRLADATRGLSFDDPVAVTYRPLDYAWEGHAAYLQRYGQGRKRVLFVGMNPGPWGMVQTGVPFGAVPVVRDWLGLRPEPARPKVEHPKRPVLGLACPRVEVSGLRLWGLFEERFGAAEDFFKEHLVINYCPLAFMTATGRNLPPDQLPAEASARIYAACDRHLREVAARTRPEWVVAVGAYVARRMQQAGLPSDVRCGQVLHPSPASPAANRGWAQQATEQLRNQGIW